VACAEAGNLISPFVGRIYDWYKKEAGARRFLPIKIRRCVRHSHLQTITEIRIQEQVMGASFRNVNQIVAWRDAICSPSVRVLDQLEQAEGVLDRELDRQKRKEIKKNGSSG